jgi:predicted secreted protein
MKYEEGHAIFLISWWSELFVVMADGCGCDG